jgi:hypothetical protein
LEQRLALIQRQFRERNPDATLSTAGAVRIAMLRGPGRAARDQGQHRLMAARRPRPEIRPRIVTDAQLANYLGKSVSWLGANRLKDFSQLAESMSRARLRP